MALPLIKDRYAIVSKLGEGGMGRVFKATDTRLGRTVAIKLMPRVDRPDLIARFRREAMAIARLNHPHIVTIFDYDHVNGGHLALRRFATGSAPPQVLDPDLIPIVVDDAADELPVVDPDAEDTQVRQPFIVMEFLPGRDIDRAGLYETGRILEAGIQVCDALAYAHSEGIVHRDIKPENIRFLPSGRIKLVDFGIATFGDQPRITSSGELLGTFAYMSPEQALGQTVDERSDIYSVGLVIFELLTGRLPFSADNVVASLSQRVAVAPPRVSRYRSDLPDDLDQLLTRALHRDKVERFPTVIALRDALVRIQSRMVAHNPATVVGMQPSAGPSVDVRIASAPTQVTSELSMSDLPLLVGRTREQAMIETLIDEARHGLGGALFIGGEPGAGKSSLARAAVLMARADGFVVHRGRVHDESRVPFEPFLEMIREHHRSTSGVARAPSGSDYDVVSRYLPALDPQSDDSPSEPPDPDSHRSMIGAVVRLIESIAENQPVLIVLDDFHDADEESVATLRRLLSVVKNRPIAMIVEHCHRGLQRDEPFHGVLYGVDSDKGATRIDLPRLSPAATHDLVSRWISAPPAWLAHEIHDLSSGRPLFAAELLKSITGPGQAKRSLMPLTIPLQLSEPVARRAESLPDGIEAALRAAVVSGRFGFDFDRIAALSKVDEDDLIDALEVAAAAFLVATEDHQHYVFDSGIAWRTLYSRIHPRRRARLHRALADQADRPLIRAYHLSHTKTETSDIAEIRAAIAAACEREALLGAQECLMVKDALAALETNAPTDPLVYTAARKLLELELGD